MLVSMPKGETMRNAPAPVATLFPPRKPRKTGYACPSIAKNPAMAPADSSCRKCCPSQTAAAPLATSKMQSDQPDRFSSAAHDVGGSNVSASHFANVPSGFELCKQIRKRNRSQQIGARKGQRNSFFTEDSKVSKDLVVFAFFATFCKKNSCRL